MAGSVGVYRKTGGMYVCSPTTYMKDVATLEAIVSQYKKLNGRLPPQVEAALQTAKAGQNVEQSLNIACDGLFKFYIAEQNRCAQSAGFSGIEDMQRRRPSEWQQIEQVYDPCIAAVQRKWMLTNIDYGINLGNPESAARQFLDRSRKQVMDIVGKYVKKAVLQKAKGTPPPYERPRMP